MDKYLALVRKTVRQYILYVKAHKLNEDSVDQCVPVECLCRCVCMCAGLCEMLCPAVCV